jgi:hypothetical protein
MNLDIKGNYFHNNFYLPPTTGLDSSYTLLEKISPADESVKLWQCPIDARHINPIIESVEMGHKTWSTL